MYLQKLVSTYQNTCCTMTELIQYCSACRRHVANGNVSTSATAGRSDWLQSVVVLTLRFIDWEILHQSLLSIQPYKELISYHWLGIPSSCGATVADSIACSSVIGHTVHYIHTCIHTTEFIERQNREERIGGAGTEWLGSESWLEKVWFKMTLKCTEIVDRANMCR